MSDAKRNETGLLCDVLGLESLVDETTSQQQQKQFEQQIQQKQQQQQQQRQRQQELYPLTATGRTRSIHIPAALPTPSAILGPFYREGAPLLPMGASILQAPTRKNLTLYRQEDAAAASPSASRQSSSSTTAGPSIEATSLAQARASYDQSLEKLTRVSGRVLSAFTGRAVAGGATIEVWQASPDGLYEQQDALQPAMNLRGRFVVPPLTEEEEEEAEASAKPYGNGEDGGGGGYSVGGRYGLVCLRPTPYPVPDDGPAGRLLHLLDRHPNRPGHLHFVVRAPGYAPLTTQLFDRDDPLVDDDSVFAVKNALCVPFRPFADADADAAAAGRGQAQEEGKGEDGDGIDWEGERKKCGQPLPKWHLEFDFSLVELEGADAARARDAPLGRK